MLGKGKAHFEVRKVVTPRIRIVAVAGAVLAALHDVRVEGQAHPRLFRLRLDLGKRHPLNAKLAQTGAHKQVIPTRRLFRAQNRPHLVTRA